MGSGKSTVGLLLAARLGWAYHDNDAILLAQEGMTARQIVAERGDASLLAAEVGALRRAVAEPPPCVIGVAARAILDPGARQLMSAGIATWLRVTPETIHERAAGAAHRPWPDVDPIEWIRTAVAERNPLYASVADLTVDADMATPPELADEITAHLLRRGCLPSPGP